MALALLILAAVVCVAPWRSAAVDRLALVELPGPDRTGSVEALAHGPLSPRALADLPELLRGSLARLGSRLPGRRSAAPDPGALAQLLDLMTAAFTAGLPAADAFSAVADALEGSRNELARPLRSVAARLRLGATPGEAWRDVPGDACLAPVASVLIRACEGGGSVRVALSHAAERMRSEADAAATARAERAAVLVAGPLGLCFLPAFICLGVLPVVVGLAGDMLPGIGLGPGQ